MQEQEHPFRPLIGIAFQKLREQPKLFTESSDYSTALEGFELLTHTHTHTTDPVVKSLISDALSRANDTLVKFKMDELQNTITKLKGRIEKLWEQLQLRKEDPQDELARLKREINTIDSELKLLSNMLLSTTKQKIEQKFGQNEKKIEKELKSTIQVLSTRLKNLKGHEPHLEVTLKVETRIQELTEELEAHEQNFKKLHHQILKKIFE